VAALIIALAINAGFTKDLQDKLLGAQAHISINPKDRTGISDYLAVTKQIDSVPGVVAAAPSVFATVLISSGEVPKGVVLKGIIPDLESKISALSKNIVQGSLSDFGDDSIVIGKDLADLIGSYVGDRVRIISGATRLSPMGGIPTQQSLKVTAIFSSGLYEVDTSWVYVPIHVAQRLLTVGDVASAIEVKVADIYQANAIGRQIIAKLDGDLDFTDWMTLNRSIFNALRLERLVMFITIGLIVLVAALNIVATLIMLVLEKTRDIAILMSMGATQRNIRRVFILQGVIIGIVGTVFGVIVGHTVSYFADKYRLISLAPDVYTIAYVPFHPEFRDTIYVAAVAILISFLATLYPSAAASRLHPVEALRYE
jgi:lipoprotein-releasing system permease protein